MQTTKMEEIRAAWQELGLTVEPSRIVSHLLKKNIKVGMPQVYTARKELVRQKQGANGQAPTAPEEGPPGIEDVLEAATVLKAVRDALGGWDAVRKLVDALS